LPAYRRAFLIQKSAGGGLSYKARYSKDWLYKTFQSLEKGKMPEFPKQNEDMADFLYLDDLGELIFRIFDNWDQDDRSLEIPDVFHIR